jgi:hypothetical protein
LEGILESCIEFWYRREFDELYNDSSDWRHKELLSKRGKCSPEETCVERIPQTGNFSLCVNRVWYNIVHILSVTTVWFVL